MTRRAYGAYFMFFILFASLRLEVLAFEGCNSGFNSLGNSVEKHTGKNRVTSKIEYIEDCDDKDWDVRISLMGM